MAYARTRKRRSYAAPSRARTRRKAPVRRPARRKVAGGSRRSTAKRAARQQVVRLEIIQAPVAASNPIADAMAASKKEVKPKRARL